MKAIRRFTVRTVLPESIRPLSRLANNLRWSWHKPTEQLFADLNPQAWDSVNHDPVKLLGSLTREEIQQIADGPETIERILAHGNLVTARFVHRSKGGRHASDADSGSQLGD